MNQVLTPVEYEALRGTVKSFERKTQLDFLLLTGMRYVEAQRFQEHPDWFDKVKGFIHLPEAAQKKVKRKQKERWVRLNQLGQHATEQFLQAGPLPGIHGWNDCIKHWGQQAGLIGILFSAKITRKTWESWLVMYYPAQFHTIALSQGHTTITSLGHYLNLPFTEQDKLGIKKWVEGWI